MMQEIRRFIVISRKLVNVKSFISFIVLCLIKINNV